MSRISGLVSPSDVAAVPARVESMLQVLPGTMVNCTNGGNGALGWKGHRTGTGGAATHEGLHVAIDGRILNARELRTGMGELPDGDLALLAALYRRHGFEGMLERLVGDFAVAIYEPKDGVVSLGRDRFGVKPLYYSELSGGGFAFSSQPRALLALGIQPDINRGFAARFVGLHYRTFDNAPEESPYAHIRQLPAAHWVRLAPGGARQCRPYWMLTPQPEWTDGEEVLAERYRELLMKSVSRRVNAVERPAFTLSGGLDSSSVLCCSSVIQNRKQVAFSSVYVDPTYDEREEIKDVVVERVSEWVPVELDDEIDIFGIVSDMVRVHDEPVATATWLSHHLLSRIVAERGHTALFGGLGGDELNAGEYEYFPMYFADLRVRGQEELLAREVDAWARHHDHPIHRKNRQVAEQMMAGMVDLQKPGRCLPNRERMLRYADAVRADYFDLGKFAPVMDAPFPSYLKNRTYQDMLRETLPCCLRAEDRQCTAVGLEHFDPFLDHELVEFMFRVPGQLQIRDGVTKQLLRRAMRGVLPEPTRTRVKKTGWNAPAHRWFGGSALSVLKDMVASDRFRNQGVFDPVRVLALIDDHVRILESGTNQENHMMFLWQVLNVSLWLDGVQPVPNNPGGA